MRRIILEITIKNMAGFCPWNTVPRKPLKILLLLIISDEHQSSHLAHVSDAPAVRQARVSVTAVSDVPVVAPQQCRVTRAEHRCWRRTRPDAFRGFPFCLSGIPVSGVTVRGLPNTLRWFPGIPFPEQQLVVLSAVISGAGSAWDTSSHCSAFPVFCLSARRLS